MKAVLVATIGTRDLMFQVTSGLWYNIGDDRMRDGDILGEQAEIISDFRLGATNYRNLTRHLLEQVETYRERLKPVIIGKLVAEKAAEIEKVYLIGTDQNLEIVEREKDTLHTCELIKVWIEFYHQISVEIILLGIDGTNPANFEQMFQWWQKTWRTRIKLHPLQPVLVCLKGGVGQAAEAARVSGLSVFGERIQFFEFKPNSKANQAGICSEYSKPYLGTSYLWNRTQQQAVRLLQHYDYAEVSDLLAAYFQQDTSGWGTVPIFIKAGIAWNQGDFKQFFQLAKSSLTTVKQRRENHWWWMAYEQAYLSVVRLKQKNTTEAMLHSYRAIEGTLYLWAQANFPDYVCDEAPDKYPVLLKSICDYKQFSSLESYFSTQPSQKPQQIELKGKVLHKLIEITIPQISSNPDFQAFCREARRMRNLLSHRLGGLPEKQLFTAWGEKIKNQHQWENRILKCLNLFTSQSFCSLAEASVFCDLHLQVLEQVSSYEMKPYL